MGAESPVLSDPAEQRHLERSGASRDFAEGVSAFVEKRKPHFEGR